MVLGVYVLVDIIHFIKILLVYDMFFMLSKRDYKSKCYVTIADVMIISIISVITYYCKVVPLVMLLSVATIIILLCLTYREKITIMIISGMWILFTLSMIDMMSTIMVEVVTNLAKIGNDNIIKLGASIISLLFVYIVGREYNKRYKKGIMTIGTKNLIWFSFLAVADALVITVLAFVTINEFSEEKLVFYSLAFVIVIIGIFIQLGAVILIFMQRNVYKEKKQITEKYLDEQKNHYEYLEKREIETKKFRHDLRKHMQMLSMLANNGQYDKIDDYLDAINVKIESFRYVVTVKNGIVDAIINQYYSRAMESGVEMKVKGIFPRDCLVEAYDLCTIFSNVLSNALEAAIEADNKKIHLECRYNSKKIIIIVSNTFRDEGQFDNGTIKTRKGDIDYHGYGLANIRESIEKYNGVSDIEISEGVFTISIMLNYIEKREHENCNNR